MDILPALWPSGLPTGHWLNVFALPDRTSYYYDALPDSGRLATTLAGADAYYGVGLAKHPGERRSRYTQGEIECIPGVWIDVDLKGANDREAIFRLMASTIPATIHVSTGGGYHLYWLFDQPLFGAVQIRALLGGWKAYMVERAASVDCQLDAMVIEPARVLRLTGFPNRKPNRDNYVVNIVKHDPKCVYHPSDIPVLEYAAPLGVARPPVSTNGHVGEGLRNDSLYRFCCYLRGVYGADGEQLRVLAYVFYNEMMSHDPPVSDREIEQIVRSAARHNREVKMDDKAARLFEQTLNQRGGIVE